MPTGLRRLLCSLPYTFHYIFVNACVFSKPRSTLTRNSALAPRVCTLVLFIAQVLAPTKRLGCEAMGGYDPLKAHVFFKGNLIYDIV